MFKQLSIDQFTKTLASDSPVPGGGSSAAMAGAAAGSLVAMVASLTTGKKGYEEHWDEMSRISEEMEGVRNFFLEAMDRDADSYAKVIGCFKLPKNSEEEKKYRSKAIQDALYGAALVPLEIAEKAAGIFEYAKSVIEKGNENAASDGAVAALMARASVKGALYNVKINAASLKDPARKAGLLEKAADLEIKADAAEQEILGLLVF